MLKFLNKLALKSPNKKTTNPTDIIQHMSGLPTHVVGGVTDLVTSVTDYLKVAEQESTKRTGITANRDIALATIQAQRDTISEMLKYTFQERAVVLQKQFDTLDQALANGNIEMVSLSLNAMVSVIQSSPFKSIQEMQQSLGNKDFTIRLE